MPAKIAAMIKKEKIANILLRLRFSIIKATSNCVKLCITAPIILKPTILNFFLNTIYVTPITKELVNEADKLNANIGKEPNIPASKAFIQETITAPLMPYIVKAIRVITFANPILSHGKRGIANLLSIIFITVANAIKIDNLTISNVSVIFVVFAPCICFDTTLYLVIASIFLLLLAISITT